MFIPTSDTALITTAIIVQFKILLFIACLSKVAGALTRNLSRLESKRRELHLMNSIHV
jgi:HAMP domain-containing protein